MIDKNISNKAKKLILAGRRTEARKYIQAATGLKERQAQEWTKRLAEEQEAADSCSEKLDSKSSLEFSEEYVYNSDTKKYIFFCKKAGKNIVLESSVVEAIISSYSNFDGEQGSINQISAKFQIPRVVLMEILRILSFTHDSVPVTQEKLAEKDEDVIVEDLLSEKRFSLLQRFQKKDWEQTKNDAVKWNEYQSGLIKPLENFLDTWQPPAYKTYKPIVAKEKNAVSFLAVLSDLHYGAKSNAKSMFRGESMSTQWTVNCVNKYWQEIITDIKKFNLNIECLNIISLGDILHSSNNLGMTTKGTPLRCDLMNEEMFDAAFNSLCEFIDQLSRVAQKTIIRSCPGNHFGVGDSILFKALSMYFREQPNISFEIIYAPLGVFVERSLGVVYGHGASNFYKAKVFGPKLQSIVQSAIIHCNEDFRGVKAKAALFADLHHTEQKQFNDFDFYLFPSVTRSDEYADSLGLYGQPRQQSLVLDDEGIKAVLNYRF